MTKKEQYMLFTCNINDFINDYQATHFGDIDSLYNSISYMLKHGLDNEYTNCDLKELIFMTKNEVAKEIAGKQLNVNPNDLTNLNTGYKEDALELKQFFNDPIGYLHTKLQDEEFVDTYRMPIEHTGSTTEEEKLEYKNKTFANARRLVELFGDENFKNEYKAYERDMKKNHVFKTLLNAKLFEDNNTIEESFNKQKPGFFEKLFNTTSEEYNNFKSAYRNFNNPEHALYGNEEVLKDAAMGYLSHKFPSLKKGELPTEEQIAKLSGAGKERAGFCLKIVQVYDYNHPLQEQADRMLNAINSEKIANNNSEINNIPQANPIPVYEINNNIEKDSNVDNIISNSEVKSIDSDESLDNEDELDNSN